MQTIVYELNEVPKKLFEFYSDAFPESAFAKLRNNSRLFETVTADVGSLSPWVTWPTMHKGVSNLDHTISDLGQDLSLINNEFPSLWDILAKRGVNVGVFGCLQSYPLPEQYDHYAFYIPDTFAQGIDYNPKLRDLHLTGLWKRVSVLDYAPSVLKEFGLSKMPYMMGDSRLFS